MNIFVFGSNLAGRHGKGAALHARQNHGAIYGRGIGLQGQSYAIPTKDFHLRVMSLDAIEMHVKDFIRFANHYPGKTFNVTRIGCGLAGYTDSQIAPMFVDAPINCNLPEGWRKPMTQEFKLIVAGGRDFDDYDKLSRTLIALADVEYADKDISIVSGMARGADALGVRFAREHSVELYQFPADWNKYGKAAGHRRNAEMAKVADGLLAFWDGRSAGTRNMIETMRMLNKPVHLVMYDPIKQPEHHKFHQLTGRFTKA